MVARPLSMCDAPKKKLQVNLAEFKSELKSNVRFLYPKQEIDEIFFRLVAHHLQKSKAEAVLSYNETLDVEQLRMLEDSVSRLAQGVPIQYVVGKVEFAGCIINTCEEVLIPRPETESLVHWMAKEHPNGGDTLDICTGSGCIALGFAHLTQAKITGWDFSKKALGCATQNAVLNQIPMKVECINVFDFPSLSKSWDIIVSNPPYVLDSEKSTMHINVLDYEPHEALFVPDDDPVVFYNLIADFAAIHLNPRGSLYFELNPHTANEVHQLLKTKGFTDIVVVNDIRGLPRMMRAKKL